MTYDNDVPGCLECAGHDPDAHIRESIKRKGWTGISVGAGEGEPCFHYTIGLTELRRHPEFILFDLPLDGAGHVLTSLAERVRDGERFWPGQIIKNLHPTYRLALIRVLDSSRHLIFANSYSRKPWQPPIAALQVVWPDVQGRLPWEEGYDLRGTGLTQPLLGTPIGAT